MELTNDGALYIKTYHTFIPTHTLHEYDDTGSNLSGSGSDAREKETWRQETTNQRGRRRSQVWDAADATSSSSDHMTPRRP